MTRPDPDAQRLRWVEENAGVYEEPDEPDEPDTLDWYER